MRRKERQEGWEMMIPGQLLVPMVLSNTCMYLAN